MDILSPQRKKKKTMTEITNAAKPEGKIPNTAFQNHGDVKSKDFFFFFFFVVYHT